MEELGTHSKFGQGHYRYIGNIIEDGSAIYGQSEDHPGGRSVILVDWQGDKKWIGTVITVLPYHFVIMIHRLMIYRRMSYYLLYLQYYLANSVIWMKGRRIQYG